MIRASVMVAMAVVSMSVPVFGQTPPEPKPILVLDANNRVNIAPTLDVTFDGNVGIGTAVPTFKLDVQGGQVNATGGLCIAGDCRTSWPSATGSLWTASGSSATYTIGNVGIGTTSPNYRLDVQGGQINASGGLCLAGDCRTAWSQIGGSPWTVSGTTVGYIGGDVSVGIATPQARLQV